MNRYIVCGEHGAFSTKCTEEHLGVWRSIKAAEMLMSSK
jgi:hypothetical protein